MTTIEKIRSKIQEALHAEGDSESAKAQALALFWVLEIIDKYAEQEPKVTTTSTDETMVMQYPQVDGITPTVVKAEQEPCDDAVSRQAVLDLIEHYNSDGLGSVFYGYEQGVKFADAVNKLPSVRPQEQTGHWETSVDRWGEVVATVNGYRCSECGEFNGYNDKYCPNCGCRMVEPQESEDKE